MRRNYSNEEIDKLILLISKLPGYGPKSASRAVLHLLKRKDQLMVPLSESLLSASKNILTCDNCGNIDLVQLMVPLSESLLSASKNILTCDNCGNIDLVTVYIMC